MTLTVVRRHAWVPEDLDWKRRTWSPKSHLGRYIRDVVGRHLPAEVMAELVEMVSKTVILESSLRLRVIRGEWATQPFVIEDYGVVSTRVITTAGVNFLVDAWQNITELESFKYHGIGTGSTAEAVGETALVTELTTEYNPDNTRATGSLTEGASANIFRSVGTNTVDAAPAAALREHGLFSAASAGTLWDRSLYAAITLASGDGLQATYDMTASAGG